MPIRFGVVPVISIGETRGPAFIRWHQSQDDPALIDVVRYGCVDYRFIDRGVLVVEADAAILDDLASREGVIAFPSNLDTQPGGAARTQIRDALEAINIPAQWVANGMTWREIARIVTGMFLFAQALRRRTGVSPLDWPGVTWSTSFGSLDVDQQAAFQLTYAGLGGQGTLPAGATLRQIMRQVADIWATRPLHLGVATL